MSFNQLSANTPSPTKVEDGDKTKAAPVGQPSTVQPEKTPAEISPAHKS